MIKTVKMSMEEVYERTGFCKVEKTSTQIECELCGLITTSDNADLVEGDGYVSPSEYWVCVLCQNEADYEREG